MSQNAHSALSAHSPSLAPDCLQWVFLSDCLQCVFLSAMGVQSVALQLVGCNRINSLVLC
jgi:hypothetical protein